MYNYIVAKDEETKMAPAVYNLGLIFLQPICYFHGA